MASYRIKHRMVVIFVVLLFVLVSSACALMPPKKIQQRHLQAAAIVIGRVVEVAGCCSATQKRHGRLTVKVVHAVKSQHFLANGELLSVDYRCPVNPQNGLMKVVAGSLDVHVVADELVLLYLRAKNDDGVYRLIAEGSSVIHLN